MLFGVEVSLLFTSKGDMIVGHERHGVRVELGLDCYAIRVVVCGLSGLPNW